MTQQRRAENSLDVHVSHGVRALGLIDSLDTKKAVSGLKDGNGFAARDVADVEVATLVCPETVEGRAFAPVGHWQALAFGKRRGFAQCLVRAGRIPDVAVAAQSWRR